MTGDWFNHPTQKKMVIFLGDDFYDIFRESYITAK
jgi:hypothetical protein